MYMHTVYFQQLYYYYYYYEGYMYISLKGTQTHTMTILNFTKMGIYT